MILLYRQESIKVGYHPVKFRGHRHSDNGDIVVLVCHVISQDHMIKGHVTLQAEAYQNKLPS